MKIFVCIKQVPDTETKIKINPDQSDIDPTGIKWIINPYDEIAIEEAVRLRETHPGAQAIGITLGPKSRATEALRSALALGLDEGLLIHSNESLDSFCTARVLADVIQQEKDFKIVFAGKLAIDDNGSSVGQMVAEFLNVPYATAISKFSISPETALVQRDLDGEAKEVVELSLPSVVSVNKGLNTPRYASLPNIMKAKKKPIKEIEISSLGAVGPDIKVKLFDFCLPPEKPPVKMIGGDMKDQASTLVNLLRDEAKIL